MYKLLQKGAFGDPNLNVDLNDATLVKGLYNGQKFSYTIWFFFLSLKLE